MTPAESINSSLAIFNWNWWQVFLFTFTLAWIIGRVIKGLEPMGWERPLKKGGREIYWSGFYGDIFLPMAIASSIVILKNFDGRETWYTSTWWHWLGLLLGFVIILFLELRNEKTRERLFKPSKLYHTFIVFPIMFYLVFVTTIPMFVSHKPTWAFVMAFICYGIWDLTYMHDVLHPPDPTKTH